MDQSQLVNQHRRSTKQALLLAAWRLDVLLWPSSRPCFSTGDGEQEKQSPLHLQIRKTRALSRRKSRRSCPSSHLQWRPMFRLLNLRRETIIGNSPKVNIIKLRLEWSWMLKACLDCEYKQPNATMSTTMSVPCKSSPSPSSGFLERLPRLLTAELPGQPLDAGRAKRPGGSSPTTILTVARRPLHAPASARYEMMDPANQKVLLELTEDRIVVTNITQVDGER